MPQKLCICQICNCGRHRCPHRPGDETRVIDPSTPCLMSEYDAKYTGDPGDRQQSFKPHKPPYRDPEVQMEKESTQHRDYIPHALHHLADFKPHLTYEEPTNPMDLTSTYTTQYNEKQGEPGKSFKPANRPIRGGQFRSDATYGVDYKEWPVKKRELVLPQTQLNLPNVKFDNKSEMQSRYVNQDWKPADSMRPPQIPMICTVPFDNKTSHQIEYTPKEMPDKFQREKMAFQPPLVPFDTCSNYQHNYQGEKGEASHCFKPIRDKYRYQTELSGQSTHQHDFVPLELPEKIHRKLPVYEPNEIPMDLNTTQKTDFHKYDNYEKAVPIRPVQRKHGGGRFTGISTQHADYVARYSVRPHQVVHDKPWEPPQYKFDGKTEFQSRYTGDKGDPACSQRPPLMAPQPMPFNTETSYHIDYTGRKMEDCPAKPEHLQHDFVFVENCKEIIYNNQAANADIDSSNHRDYQRYNASPPVRVRKKLSAKLLLGQDGDPTYLSTSTEAFQNYSLPFNQRSKLADGVNQQEDHIILGSNSARSASRMLSTNHADYLKYDMLQRQKPSHVNYLNDSGFVFGSDDPQYLTSSQAQFDSKRLQRRLSQENLLTTEQVDKRKQHDLFRSSSGLLFGGGAQSARSAAVTATQQTLARKVAAERPAAGFTKSPLNYMDQTKELFPGGDQQNVERNHVSQKLAFDPDRPAAGLNRNGLGQKDKSAIVFGEDGRQWNATTTSAEAFKRQNQSNSAAAGMATVPRRDLFQMSDGFMLGQDGQESPRYSSAAGRRSRKISQKTKDRLRRLLAAQDNGDGVDPLENYDDLLEMYNYYKQNSRMGKSEKNAGSEWSPRESRSRRSRHTEATGGASVPESAYADAASSNRSRLTPMSLAQLQEELRSLREANQDANEQGGLLWFPIANENNGKQRRKVETKDLPKWAEDALKEAPVQPDEYQKQITRLAATNIAQEALATKNISHANAAGTKSLQDRDSSADRLTNIAGFEGTEGSRRKKQSIPSSSDEGLVMDNSLRESPRSQINQRNQNRPPAGLPSRQKPTSIFASDQTEEKAGLTRNSSRAAGSYPDSIESGRQSSRMWRSDTERGDSLDSLQSRRVSPRIELESPTTADYTRREMYLNKKGRVPRSASVEEAIRGNTTKIRVPKLIPVNRAEDDDDGDNGALTESNAQEANSGLSAEKEEIGRMGSTFKPGSPTSVARPISVSKSKKKKETAVKDTAPSLPEEPISKTDQQRTRENGKSDPLQQNDAKENMAETTDFQDNKRAVKMAAAAAAAGTMASILTHPDQSQSLTAAKIKRKKQRSSSTESAAGLRSRISPDQQVASIPPAADHENVRTSSGNRRKGRRAVAKDKSQYPRATSLAGLLKQGFLEQTTTSNDAFPPHDKSDFSRSRSARQRNTETANFKDAIFPVTSRPVQRTPPTTANPTNGWPAATTPILRSPRMASSRLLPDADPTSTPPLESAMRLEHFRQKRQLASKGPQERLPDGYERTQPIRYPDNLAFDTSGKFLDRSSNNHDYQGLQPDQPLRIQSLDRKQLRSQIGDLLYSPAADDRFRPRLDDVERVRAPSLEEGFHAGDQRRSLIVHKDHDIFQNKDKFTSTTEAGDAFQLPAAGQDARRRLLRPKSQQDLLGRKQGSLSATGPSRSVSQEAYQNVGNVAFDRAQPFKPETQLHLFDRTNIMTGNSVSQDAYQNASGTAIGRVKSFKPEANLPLFDSTNHVTGNSVSHEAYQSAGNLPFDRAQPFKPETQLHLFNSTNHVTGKSVSQDSFNNSGNAAVDRVQPFKPETNLPLFDTTNHVTGHSVSQDAYQKADHNVVDRVHPFKPENNLTLFDSTNHVTGHSVSRDTYQNGAAVPFDQVQAFRPQTELSLFDKQHLTGSSISHEAYSAHGGQPIERRHPIRPKSALKLFNSNPNSASNSAKRRRQSISFSQNSLPPLVPSANQNRLARLKMTQSRNDSHQSFQSHSKDPFSQSTTSYDDYANPGHDPPPALIRQNSGGVFYQSNGQHMSDVTTSGLAFVRPPTGNSRIKPVLPRRSSFFDPATGDKVVQSTTNQDYYAPHDALPPIRTHSQPPTRADSANLLYHRSNITSTAPPQSTNQEHFKTFNIEGIGRRHPAKNQQIESAINPLTGNVRVFANGDRSRTAVDHNAESDVCPAALLQAGAKSWKFLGNEAGHLFFDLDT